jgi:O-succinylbenzoate synthase
LLAGRWPQVGHASVGGVVIGVDSNMAWTPEEAKEFTQMIKGLGVSWLEEPIHWRNELRGLRAANMGAFRWHLGNRSSPSSDVSSCSHRNVSTSST